MNFNYTLEDFKGMRPYKDLLDIESDYEKQQAKLLLAENAKKVGYKGFGATLKAFEKEIRLCSLTEIDTKPPVVFDRYDGNETPHFLGRWNYDKSGIWRTGRDGGREYACTHPIYPSGILHNIDANTKKVKLKYLRGDSGWSECTVDYEIAANHNKIIQLSTLGIDVTSGRRASNLVEYISDFTAKNYDNIPKIKAIDHLGWNSEGFAPYNKNIEFDGNPNFKKVFQAISFNGSIEAWSDEIEKCRQYSLVTHILIAASFASALIKPLGIQPFFVHLWGMDSGTGKTVAQMAAASVWGNPTVGGAFFPTFKGTSTGFESMAGFLHSIPLFIDELQMAKDKNGKVVFNVYELAAGTGKLRGTKTLGVADTPTWNNCFITSGETPIVGEQDGAGALNRVIEIECTADKKCIEDGHRTASVLKENYGIGGRVFIAKFEKEGFNEVEKIYQLMFRECLKHGTTEKQAHSAAAILTADMIATDLFFNDKALTPEQMAEFLKSTETVSASARGYHYMCDWVIANRNKFGAVEFGEFYGIIEDNYAYIIPSVFDKACSDAGINSKALRSHLKTKGLLKCNSDGKGNTITKRLTPTTPPVRCVCMRLNLDNENQKAEGF